MKPADEITLRAEYSPSSRQHTIWLYRFLVDHGDDRGPWHAHWPIMSRKEGEYVIEKLQEMLDKTWPKADKSRTSRGRAVL